jgi:spore protease
MDKEVDLSKYQIRTDLTIEELENKSKLKGVKIKTKKTNGIIVTSVVLDEKNDLNKKKGKYTTLEFDDVTDSENITKISDVLLNELKEIIKVKKNSHGLVVGLGNDKSTPDSLGPLTINNIIVTNHIYLLDKLSDNYNRISAINPGVMGQTGIETSDIIESVVNKIKPDYLIVIDSLASRSMERLNKTIQVTDTGIHPGSGIGNKRKEISYDTLGIPVIAIGVPTVVDAAVIVSDTINFIYKNYEFNRHYVNNPKSKFTFNNVNYLNSDVIENQQEKEKLLGLVGTLNEEELETFIYEVLNPIGYNLMVTPKEIDFIIQKLALIISDSINKTVHSVDKNNKK